MINAYRVAGLLVLLVTVAHGQTINQGVAHAPLGYVCAKNCVIASVGIIRDGDYEEAREIAKANGIDVSKWSYEQVQMQDASDRSRGDDAILDGDYVQPVETKSDKLEKFVFKNWYWIVGAVVVIFLFLQFSSGGEANETDINDLDDPDYRTGFTSDYHGDDVFEVPDGMHSQHQIVPVRSRSAGAGR